MSDTYREVFYSLKGKYPLPNLLRPAEAPFSAPAEASTSGTAGAVVPTDNAAAAAAAEVLLLFSLGAAGTLQVGLAQAVQPRADHEPPSLPTVATDTSKKRTAVWDDRAEAVYCLAITHIPPQDRKTIEFCGVPLGRNETIAAILTIVTDRYWDRKMISSHHQQLQQKDSLGHFKRLLTTDGSVKESSGSPRSAPLKSFTFHPDLIEVMGLPPGTDISAAKPLHPRLALWYDGRASAVEVGKRRASGSSGSSGEPGKPSKAARRSPESPHAPATPRQWHRGHPPRPALHIPPSSSRSGHEFIFASPAGFSTGGTVPRIPVSELLNPPSSSSSRRWVE